jgi:hypothetical protein
MSAITVDQIQADIKARLVAHAYFADVPVYIENDFSLTPAEEKAQADIEESALLEKGLGLKILSPESLGSAIIRGRLMVKAAIGIAIVEDVAANRAASGLRKPPLVALHHAIAALIPYYECPPQPFGGLPPDDGTKSYTLIVVRDCLITGA